MVAEPLLPGLEMPRRHCETGVAIARWFTTATSQAREVFIAHAVACWKAAAPDMRLLRCLTLCLAVERQPGSSRGALLVALIGDGQPLRQMVDIVLSLASLKHRDELGWALEVLLAMLALADAGMLELLPQSGGSLVAEEPRSMAALIMDAAEAALPFAPAEAAQILLSVAQAAAPPMWSKIPETRGRLLQVAARMLEAAGPGARPEIIRPLHSALKLALMAYDPRKGVGSWVSADAGKIEVSQCFSAEDSTRKRSAIAPSKRWARGVRNPCQRALAREERWLTEH